MKTSKEIIYEYIERTFYIQGNRSKGIETKEVADALEMQRSNVSSLLNELVKDGKLEKTATRPVLYVLPQNNKNAAEKSFSRLVGSNGSLRKSIQLAQAAVLYPKKSLNVLLSSKIGCGTSAFVYEMYRFAVENEVIAESSPYIKVNCRHFSKSIEILNDELFGVNNIEECAFSKAQGGMLFIDNVDYLNAKQQNMLFNFLENLTVYSEKNKNEYRFEDILLVISCSPALREEYERRVPVIVTLPELKNRDYSERYELINRFFFTEALNSDCTIEVSNEVIQTLLLADFQYNIKEIYFEIKSACANAYVRAVNDQEKKIYVLLDDFKTKIQKKLFRLSEIEPELELILNARETTTYDKEDHSGRHEDDVATEFYVEIRKQYDELAQRGINKAGIAGVIDAHIKSLFRQYKYEYTRDNAQEMEQLAKIVDSRIIEIVQKFLKKQSGSNEKILQRNVVYGLCLHINSLLTLNIGHQRIDNQQIVELIQNYPQEYAAGLELGQELKVHLGLELPLEEIAIIALFLIEPDESEEVSGRPVLLYILHGSDTARSLCDITNALTHCQNAYSYDLALEIETAQALSDIKSLIQKIDQGQGVIVIYDMGSIKTMLDTISEEINVKIRYMNIPITLVGIDVARKCSMESDVDYVYHMANLEINKLNSSNDRYRNVIVTLCHTGGGGAVQLKQYIGQYSRLGMKIIALAISNRDVLLEEVMALKKVYNIHAFVGTYNPKLFGIPFISIEKIFEHRREDLDRVLLFEPVQVMGINFEEVYSYLGEQFKYTSIPKLKSALPDVVDELTLIYSLPEVKTVGLFMHLACLVERLLEGGTLVDNPRKEKFLEIFKEECRVIGKIVKKLEKKFNILIDDNEIATILMIIKEL
ncbi:MAG: PRD domain-containing protein [Anaerorhabdus sp.]